MNHVQGIIDGTTTIKKEQHVDANQHFTTRGYQVIKPNQSQ
jgi:hypothetical protein